MKKILLATIILATFSACQKEIDFNTPSGNSGSGDTSSNDYQPVTANSVWNLKSTSLGDYTLTALGSDSTINALKYHKFLHSKGGVQYVSKVNGVYRQFANVPQAGGWVDMIYLKDVAAGATWTSMLGAVEMRYAIAATGLQKTVNGKQYSNVIKVSYQQYAMGMQTAIGDQYYAKGVGPIEGVSKIDMLGIQMTVDSTYLVSSSIK